MRAALIWLAVLVLSAVPVVLSLASPLLQWRDPVYIAAGATGVLAMALMPLQPLLATGRLPGLGGFRGRRLHRIIGALLLLCLLLHVAGLWITSPPDVIDVFLLRSPTPFSTWGLLAMVALLLSAAITALRKPLRLRWRLWRVAHLGLAAVVIGGTVAHALLIEGTMEPVSKALLSLWLTAAFAGSLAAPLRHRASARRQG
ncbi:Ferric reductase like transmembrane component [Pseudoruegeria aquimaris]|uniref:Ferric reductase like transmembrane component n=2 Tax=Pseudoruegeria aquimaris TaxID=393663 RepID=A0A1Y5R9C6_9RHOB|nr:Ferric reductase like transmembrane component [Pseudoruegeria aquimaris]